MLVVIKKKVKDNDEASNRLLQMGAGYASASIAITALSPMIFVAFRKKIENYVGGNTTSISEDSQSLQARVQAGVRDDQSLTNQSTSGNNSEQNLEANELNVQQVEQTVTGTESANIRVRTSGVETNN